MRYIGVAILIVVLAGCSSAQTFTDVAGKVRISGKVQRPLIDLQHTILSIDLSDPATGTPIDASEIHVRTSHGQTLSAKRADVGSYSATISNSDSIDVLVSARGETAMLSLKRQ